VNATNDMERAIWTAAFAHQAVYLIQWNGIDNVGEGTAGKCAKWADKAVELYRLAMASASKETDHG
jgi:hypothetical protein